MSIHGENIVIDKLAWALNDRFNNFRNPKYLIMFLGFLEERHQRKLLSESKILVNIIIESRYDLNDITKLLQMGCDPNLQYYGKDLTYKEYKSFIGATPLHIALQEVPCDFDLCEVLIRHGANINAVNNAGTKAIDMCKTKEQKARLLRIQESVGPKSSAPMTAAYNNQLKRDPDVAASTDETIPEASVVSDVPVPYASAVSSSSLRNS